MTTHPNTDWRHQAECLQEEPELFYPPSSGTRIATLQTLVAKSVCARCPVSADCLQWALDENIEYGIWGGTSEGERRKIRQGAGITKTRKQQARATVESAYDEIERTL